MTSSPPPAELKTGNSLFARYEHPAHVFDEAAHRSGWREHWRPFGAILDDLGTEEITARWENARRIIRDHGITYNIYSDPQGMDRPWELDVIPLLISPAEWKTIERGLKQRALLLNMLLEDFYGPQELLRTGALPPALLFANPAFHRACHGVRMPGNVYLHLHAADLARSSTGQWWVLADRTQSPSGSGYALENRIVMARVLPEEYRLAQVHRLAPYFAMQRDALRALAPRGEENPHIVLLTPGPHNETYFEHAYLARYLGFTLVEGGDLTVRDSKVYLKTLNGLQQVHVILRRVDDTFCDPLELRGDSFLGVAGLIQAARDGNVTIANALGASLLESPAFLAFLPSLCKTILGEELILPSVATWWCGQAQEQRYVLEHLNEIVVKPAFGPVSQLPFFGRQLTKGGKEKLLAEINRTPFAFVGQEQVSFSTAPAWINGALEARGVVLRCYTTTTGDGGYCVMSGGLTRVSGKAADPVLSMQSGGGSKDTWVLSDDPVAPITLLTPSGQPATIVRVGTELPSRVADNLFWLGRYTERLEGTLRLLRCVLERMSDENPSESTAELTALVNVLVTTERLPKKFATRTPAEEVEQAILQLVYSTNRAGSVRELVFRVRQIASMVRDRLSADTWRIINRLQLDSKSRAGRLRLTNALSVCNTLILDLAALSGMEMENMTRGHGWRFLDLGRRMERGCALAEVVRSSLVAVPAARSKLNFLLEFADSTITFRRRYFAEPRFSSVLDLLLLDAGNPRSLAFQLEALQIHARNLPAPQEGAAEPPLLRKLSEMSLELAEVPLDLLEEDEPEPTDALLKRINAELMMLSDEITQSYFAHTVSQRVEARP